MQHTSFAFIEIMMFEPIFVALVGMKLLACLNSTLAKNSKIVKLFGKKLELTITLYFDRNLL